MASSVALPLNRALFRGGDRVAVAVSGGADSTALLLALHEQAAAMGVTVSAAHLHHGIRGDEADGDLAFLEELCARLDVPLHVEREAVVSGGAISDAVSRARQGARETLEEAARHARLGFFDRLLVNGTATVIVTAHTEDDQAETVMMKLLRGAWTEGLGGISPVLERASGRVVRPLLGASRGDVVRFLEARGQGWREDSSNVSEAFTRNRVRAKLMPLLREFNPSVAATLSATAALAREEEARWRPEVERLLTQLALPGKPVRGGGRAVGTSAGEASVAFELERLKPLDGATRRRLLRAAAERMGVRLGSAEVLRLLQLAGLLPAEVAADPTVPSKPNSRLDFAGGLRAERSLRELRLTRVSSPPK